MLITILTPTLNCGPTLKDALRSVEMLHAKLPGAIQHLIGDAGSTDRSVDMLAQYTAMNSWAKVQTLRGLNIPATLNMLMRDARGQWIIVLNGDDYLDVDGMLCVVAQIGLPQAPTILCGEVGVLSVEGKSLGSRGCRLEQLDRFMSVNHPAMLVDKRIFDLVGLFDPKMPTAYDYVWTWRAFRAGIHFIGHPVVLAYARLGGISQSRAHCAAKEIFNAKVAGGRTLPALRDYVIYLLKAFLRSLLPEGVARRVTARFRQIVGSIDRY